MSDRPTPTEAGTPDVDVHVVPLGKKKGDEAFVEGYRRTGPEGLTRELVVLEVDDKGATKVADKVRQLLEKKLTSFVVDLTAVPALEGAALKEFVRAKKMAEEKSGYFSIAGAKEAVAGLLKVMGLDKEIASHNNVSTAVEQFKWHLQTKIAEKTGAAPAAPSAAPTTAQRFLTGEMVAARPEGRLAVEQIDGDFLFYPPGKKPAKKDMAGDTMILALSVRENNIAGLADEIRRAAGTGTNRIVANLFELGAVGGSAGAQLAAAVKAAEEKKARVVFSGASPETLSAMQSAGVAVNTVVFESEVAAAEQLAVELLEQKQKKGVRLKRIQGEIDAKAVAAAPVAAGKAGAEERKPAKTMQMATPTFDEEPEARPAKTAQFAAPKFDEDEESQERKPGKTMQMATPKFDEDDEEKERKPGKTQMYATPKFDEDEEERKPGKTAQMSVPKFDEDDEEKEERKPGKTQMYATPKFDEDEEERKPGKTAQLAVPKFDEDDEEERKPAKTAQMAVPKFDEDDEEKPERKPAKTAQMATPKFDDDDVVEAPTFFEEGDISSASKKKAAEAKPVQKVKTEPDRPAFKPEGRAKTDPERPAMKPEGKGKTDPERPAAGAFQEMKTQAMVGLSREEALRLAAEASGKPVPAGKSKAEPPRPAPTPAPAPAQPPKPKTEPAKPAAPAGIQEARTQAMPGLSKEEALRLAAEASGKAAPAGKPKTDPARPAASAVAPAPSQPQKPKTDPARAAAPAENIQEMKTQAIQGLTKEEALRLAAEASGKAAPATSGKPKTDPSRPAAAPPAQPPKSKTEPMRAAAPAGLQEMKTQAISGLSKEEALRLAAEAAGKPAPGGPAKEKDEPKAQRTEVMKAFVPAEPPKVEESKPQKTEVMKAFVPEAEKAEDVRTAKTQAIAGLSREEALKLAAEASGKPPSKPQSRPDIRAQKTEVLQAAQPSPEPTVSQVARTEMFQGLSKEEAMKLAAGEAAGAKKSGPAEKKTGDMKAKTDPMRQAAPQKTEQMKAFTPEPAASAAPDMKVMKTEAFAGLTKEEALKLAGEASGKKPPPKAGGTAPMMSAFEPDAPPKKNDQQAMKTEAIAGLTKEEAIKLAKAGESGRQAEGKSSDIQDFQTDRMQSPKREQAEFQQSKTQALAGMTREEAEQEAKTDPERRATGGADDGDSSGAPEAEAKKSPVMMILAVVAVVAAVGGWFVFGGGKPESTQVDQKKLEAAEEKIEAALLDSLDLEGN